MARWYANFRERTRWTDVPLILALGARVALFAVASVAARFFAPQSFGGNLNIWNRWDTVWYISIATDGYTYAPHAQTSVVFYPVLPLLLLILHYPFSFLPFNSYLVAGTLIAWVSFLAACCVLYRMTLERFGQATAYGAVLLLATFPFSLFYGAAYTESLFLLLALLAFYAIEKQRWWLAASIALIAGATRPTGVFVGVCVVAAYALDWYQTRHPLRRDLLSLALVPLGTLAYLSYCAYQWGDFFAPMRVSDANWRRGSLRLDGLSQGAYLLTHPDAWLNGTDYKPLLFGLYSVLALLFLISLPVIWRRLGPIYALYAALAILVPILTDDVMVSVGRYLSVVFPTFIVLAHALRERPAPRDALAVGGAIFLSLFTVMFVLNFEVY
jgi:Mannosyltransferase (PIG-V)